MRRSPPAFALAIAFGGLLAAVGFGLAEPPPLPAPFRITVVDEQTGRGVPAVMLRTTNQVPYWTDNAGVVAFLEPDLMGQRVYFEVGSHGYAAPELGGGWGHGVILEAKPGGSAVVKLRRENIAQRLYRFTGSGLYRDSLLLGDKPPVSPEPGVPPVMGQDGGDGIVYRDRLYWFWGDTVVPGFFLGVYRGVGAVSDLPGKGGLSPDTGIALRYFRQPAGELKPIVNMPGACYWYSLPRVCKDAKGADHLVADYAEIKAASMTVLDRGVMRWDDAAEQFELIAHHPKDGPGLMGREGSSHFRHAAGGKERFYQAAPYPCVRWPTDFEAQADPARREGFTCLKPGSRFDGSAEQLDRDAAGRLRWGWKRDTSAVAEAEMAKLIKSKAMTDEERWYAVKDVETGAPVLSHHGSIFWNPYRGRWVCIRLQNWGATLVGEAWCLEGDTPLGPWVYAQKIITHAWKDHAASFYMTAQLPFFDQDNGRTIYVKGSFTADFGDVKNPPPRHVYNLLLYKLELDDPRLFLPVPVWRVGGAVPSLRTKKDIPDDVRERAPLFFAPDRPRAGTVPIYRRLDAAANAEILTAEKPEGPRAEIAFYAVPAEGPAPSKTADRLLRPLHEFVDERGLRAYSTAEAMPGHRRTRTVCRVWENPLRFNPYAVAD